MGEVCQYRWKSLDSQRSELTRSESWGYRNCVAATAAEALERERTACSTARLAVGCPLGCFDPRSHRLRPTETEPRGSTAARFAKRYLNLPGEVFRNVVAFGPTDVWPLEFELGSFDGIASLPFLRKITQPRFPQSAQRQPVRLPLMECRSRDSMTGSAVDRGPWQGMSWFTRWVFEGDPSRALSPEQSECPSSPDQSHWSTQARLFRNRSCKWYFEKTLPGLPRLPRRWSFGHWGLQFGRVRLESEAHRKRSIN